MEFWDVLEEEMRLIRLLKIVRKQRENLIKADLNKGGRSDLLGFWKDY